MKSLSSSSSQTFTRLHARITQEDGAFTVSVRMLNHLKHDEKVWGEEIATSIDMASLMIDSIAKQFCIEKIYFHQNCHDLPRNPARVSQSGYANVAPSDSRSVNRYGHGPLVCKFPINVTVPLDRLCRVKTQACVRWRVS